MNEFSTYGVAEKSEIESDGNYPIVRIMHASYGISKLPGVLEVSWTVELATGRVQHGLMLVESDDPVKAASTVRYNVLNEYASAIACTFLKPVRHEGVERL